MTQAFQLGGHESIDWGLNPFHIFELGWGGGLDGAIGPVDRIGGAFLYPLPEGFAVFFGKLVSATKVSAAAALSGFAASLIAGVVIAFFFSQSRLIRISCYPYAIFLQTVPIVAIAPLVINWFGSGFRSIVIITFVISLFPIITSTTTGMLAVDPELLDLFRLNRASRWQIWLKLRLPNAVPHLITGARTSSGLSVVGALVGEYFAGFGVNNYGLGFLIGRNTSQMRTDELFAAVIASTLLGITIFGVVSIVGAFILNRWYDTK